MTRMLAILTLGLVSSVSSLCASVPPAPETAASADESACDHAGSAQFICGPLNTEDLVALPGTHWVIASSFVGPRNDKSGHLYLLSTVDRSWKTISLSAVGMAADKTLYGNCPSRPTEQSFRSHGLGLRDNGNGSFVLYAINHGGRESIEIFSIDLPGGAREPRLAWIGCVVPPADVKLNAVAPISGDGFTITKFSDKDDKNVVRRIAGREITGHLLEWHPATGWKVVAGSQMSGPNGIVASPDGQWYYIAEWAASRLVRLSRNRIPVRRDTLELGFSPDNLRFDTQGRILVTGQRVTPSSRILECLAVDRAVCPIAFEAIRVDPESLASEPLLRNSGSSAFGAATVTLDTGSEFWVGTFRGDRIAVFRYPIADDEASEKDVR